MISLDTTLDSLSECQLHKIHRMYDHSQALSLAAALQVYIDFNNDRTSTDPTF